VNKTPGFVNTRAIVIALFASLALTARAASAQTLAPQQRLCDPEFQDCRADILTYIAQEKVEIDMGYWMIDDDRYATALIGAWQRGVTVRLLMDPRCTGEHPACTQENDKLAAAGIPMRNRSTSGILHWKMILFAGQGQLEFAGANFSPFEMAPATPYQNYTDEVVFYTNDVSLLHSFMSKFDDMWTSTTEFANYANISGPLTRAYPTATEDSQLNFPNDQSYRNRAIAAYDAENTQIDAAMFRITDAQESNAIIAAAKRGVAVRLYTDEGEYRNADRLWDAFNVDMMYHAGVQVRTDAHQGINHEKAIILHGTHTSIFGSSNWTSPSSDSQREHNMFTTQSWIYTWLLNQFNRKWTNGSGHAESQPFTPLPPDVPTYHLPVNGATGVATSGVSLSWYAGPWGQQYDIYFGTTSNPPLLASNVQLGPSQSSTDYRTYALPALQPGTVYYWKIVSKTMALVTAVGPVWSFTTAGSGGGGGSSLPAGWADADVGSTGAAGSASASNGTFTVEGAGADVWGTADAFHYAYLPLSGDGTMIARVATISSQSTWVKAGLMIRGSLSASSAQAFILVSHSKGVAFQRRTANGGTSANSTGSTSTAPHWVKIVRAGNTISGYESANGSAWTLVGSDTFGMGTSAFIGLAVSSHISGTLATAAFDNVSTTSGGSTSSLPSGWSDKDIGSVPVAGSANDSGGTFSVTGSGADVWGAADAFNYAYTTLNGNGTIVARVATVQNVSSWVKAGVMIRETLTAGSRHAFILVSGANGVAFQRRDATGGASVNTAGSAASAPRWAKLTRSGNTFTAYESADGTHWTQVGSDTIAMAANVSVGLAVTSHSTSASATCTFDHVSIQ
jgi:regulation of enolase protein 1 (concanavalin A-like superfamily)